LVFPHGSRKRVIYMKFQLPIKSGNNIETIETSNTKPFVIKTNENQWQQSEGLLLKLEAFGEASETQWFKFANALQKRYLYATKQDQINPSRPLSYQDINFIYHTKFEQNTVPTSITIITVKQYEEFWKWFGPYLYKIRYQRYFLNLWVGGLICGFVSRNESEQVLSNTKSPGTFIIRFTESCPGIFAIAYTVETDPPSQTCEIRHYLMQPDDVVGPKKTLPDFLGKHKPFSYVVKVTTDYIRGRLYQQCEKNSVLQEYYSKKVNGKTSGYDNQLT